MTRTPSTSPCSARAPVPACPPSAAPASVPIHRSARQTPAPVDSAALRRPQRGDRHLARFSRAGAARADRTAGRDSLHPFARRPHPGPGRSFALSITARGGRRRFTDTERRWRRSSGCSATLSIRGPRSPRFPSWICGRWTASRFELFGLEFTPVPLVPRQGAACWDSASGEPRISPITATFRRNRGRKLHGSGRAVSGRAAAPSASHAHHRGAGAAMGGGAQSRGGLSSRTCATIWGMSAPRPLCPRMCGWPTTGWKSTWRPIWTRWN